MVTNRRPYSDAKRLGYGLYWSALTALLVVSFVVLVTTGSVGTGLLSLLMAGPAGWYAKSIWTWRAKHLVLFIAFDNHAPHEELYRTQRSADD
jgi:hypothetical protein